MSIARPVLPLTGGSSCGAIRYQVTSFPLLVYACNCTDCQRASGSAFALNMPVLAGDFHILKGEPKGWHHTSPTGVQVTSRFCSACGCRLYGERDGLAEIVNLRAGTLDDTSWLAPSAPAVTIPTPRLRRADTGVARHVAWVLPAQIVPVPGNRRVPLAFVRGYGGGMNSVEPLVDQAKSGIWGAPR